MWNPTHSFLLHVGFITRINVTIGEVAHEGTRMCQFCRDKTGDTNDDKTVDHGGKIANEMVNKFNGRKERQSIKGDRFGFVEFVDLMLTI